MGRTSIYPLILNLDVMFINISHSFMHVLAVPGDAFCERSGLCAGEAHAVIHLQRILLKVRVCPAIICFKRERLHVFSESLFSSFETEAIVVVQAHQLTAVRIGNVNIFTHDEEILIVQVGSGPAEVVRTTDDERCIRGEVDDDEFCVNENVASLTNGCFFQKALQATRDHGRRAEVCGAVSMKASDLAAGVLKSIAQNSIVWLTQQSIFDQNRPIQKRCRIAHRGERPG